MLNALFSFLQELFDEVIAMRIKAEKEAERAERKKMRDMFQVLNTLQLTLSSHFVRR